MWTLKHPPLKGVNFDLPVHLLGEDYAQQAANVRMKHGWVESRHGFVEITLPSTPGTPRWIGQFTAVDATIWTVCITDTKLFRLAGGTWVAITSTPGAFTGTGNWSVCTGEGWLFWTRQNCAGVYGWDGTTGDTVVLLSDDTSGVGTWPFGDGGTGTVLTVPPARAIEYYNNRLYLIGPVENGSYKPWRVRFTTQATIGLAGAYGATLDAAALGRGNWDAVGTLGAAGGGFYDIYDPDGDALITGKVLNNRLVLYKRSSIIDFTASGTIPIHTVDTRVRGVGSASGFTITSTGQQHLFAGTDNIWSWDGGTLTPIGDRIQNLYHSIFQQLEAASYLAGYWSLHQEFYFFGPTSSVVLVYDPYRDYWVTDGYAFTGNLTALGEGDIGGFNKNWAGAPDPITGIWSNHNETWAETKTPGASSFFYGTDTPTTFVSSDSTLLDGARSFNRLLFTAHFYNGVCAGETESGPWATNTIHRLLVLCRPVQSDTIGVQFTPDHGVTLYNSPSIPGPADYAKGRIFFDFGQSGEGAAFYFISQTQFQIHGYGFQYTQSGLTLP